MVIRILILAALLPLPPAFAGDGVSGGSGGQPIPLAPPGCEACDGPRNAYVDAQNALLQAQEREQRALDAVRGFKYKHGDAWDRAVQEYRAAQNGVQAAGQRFDATKPPLERAVAAYEQQQREKYSQFNREYTDLQNQYRQAGCGAGPAGAAGSGGSRAGDEVVDAASAVAGNVTDIIGRSGQCVGIRTKMDLAQENRDAAKDEVEDANDSREEIKEDHKAISDDVKNRARVNVDAMNEQFDASENTRDKINADDAAGSKRYLDEVLGEDPENAQALADRALMNLQMGDKAAACADAQAALSGGHAQAEATVKMSCRGSLTGGKSFEPPPKRDGFLNRGGGEGEREGQGLLARGPGGLPRGAAPARAAAAAGLPAAGGIDGRFVPFLGSATPGANPKAVGLLSAAKNYLASGSPSLALNAALQAIALDPGNAQGYLAAAAAYQSSGSLADALKMIQAGLKKDPNNKTLIHKEADLLAKLGRYEDALAAAERAILVDPSDPWGYALKARALGKMGDRDGMVAALRRAAAIDPRFEAALQQAMNAKMDSDFLFALPGERAPGSGKPADDSLLGKPMRFWLGLALVALGMIGVGAKILKGPPVPPEVPVPAVQKKSSAAAVPSFFGTGAGLSALPADQGAATAGPAAASLGLVTPAQGAPTVGPGAAAAVPALIGGKYSLGEKIGEGGMGMVFSGFDTKLDRKVAIKKMRPEIRADARGWDMFVKEARIVSHLSHPYIVGIHDLIEENGDAFLVFDFVEGRPLSEMIFEAKRLPMSVCYPVLAHVCEAIAFAHEHKVLHRDLKPANIMIADNGFAKVMDFGVAREAKSSLSRMSHKDSSGTPAYMAPEHHLGMPVPASDVYSLGACLYEMVTGDLPFKGPDFLAQKDRKMYVPAGSLVPGLDPSVDALFAAVFEPDPKKRIADPRALAAGLKTCAG